MKTQSKIMGGLLCLLPGILLLLASCNYCPPAAWTVANGPAGPGVGDYGDAPDSMLNMSAGYYGYAGSGFGLYYLTPLGVPSGFPTIEANNGPYVKDVDDFGFCTPGSAEDDAIDFFDPDGIANLDTVTGFADYDVDNGLAILVILVTTVPPRAIFLTFAHTGYETSAYWNFALDVDQNGSWEFLEWISVDELVTLNRGPNFLISRWFQMQTHGGGFGRLKLPIWGRNMITDAPVIGNVPLAGPPAHWDGRGMPGGFAKGEVEDYFFEWRPVGQVLEDTVDTEEQEETLAAQLDNLVHINTPEQIKVGQSINCSIEGAEPASFLVIYSPDTTRAGTLYAKVKPGKTAVIESEDSLIEIEASKDALQLNVERASTGSRLTLVGLTKQKNRRKGRTIPRIAGGAVTDIM